MHRIHRPLGNRELMALVTFGDQDWMTTGARRRE